MKPIVDNVVSRARVEKGFNPSSSGSSPTYSPARDNKDNNSEPVTRLIKQAFGAKMLVVWRDGKPDRPPPSWLNWPSVNGADISPRSWQPPKGRK